MRRKPPGVLLDRMRPDKTDVTAQIHDFWVS